MPSGSILVLNAGSSSLKFSMFRGENADDLKSTVRGEVDGLVFTAGIGENSPVIRERIIAACHWLGVELDAEANSRGGPRISTGGSRACAGVVPTNEELMIARHTLNLITGGTSRPESSR